MCAIKVRSTRVEPVDYGVADRLTLCKDIGVVGMIFFHKW